MPVPHGQLAIIGPSKRLQRSNAASQGETAYEYKESSLINEELLEDMGTCRPPQPREELQEGSAGRQDPTVPECRGHVLVGQILASSNERSCLEDAKTGLNSGFESITLNPGLKRLLCAVVGSGVIRPEEGLCIKPRY